MTFTDKEPLPNLSFKLGKGGLLDLDLVGFSWSRGGSVATVCRVFRVSFKDLKLVFPLRPLWVLLVIRDKFVAAAIVLKSWEIYLKQFCINRISPSHQITVRGGSGSYTGFKSHNIF